MQWISAMYQVKYKHCQVRKLFLLTRCYSRTCNTGPNTIIKKELQTFVEGSSFDTNRNLDVAHKLERKCAKGYKQRSVKFECNNLSLKPNDRNEYYLLYNYEQYPPDSFCLDSRENETDLLAQLCMKQSRKDRFE